MPRFKEESVEAADTPQPSSQTPTPGPMLPLELPENQEKLRDLRNMSEFAELVQFMSFFKSLFKISNNIDIDIIEEELMGVCPEPEIIPKLQNALISQLARSKRSLSGYLTDMNVAAWHLYASRGFSEQENPMGLSTEPEELARLETMDPSIRVTILYTFCRWIATDDGFHDKIEKLVAAAAKGNGEDEPLSAQSFKVDPVGWNGDFGVYYLLDDNRLYYMEDVEPDLSDVDPKQLPGYVEETKSKRKGDEGKTGKKRRGEPLSSMARKRRARAALRRKQEQQSNNEAEPQADTEMEEPEIKSEHEEYVSYAEALGRDTPIEKIKWRCVCVTLSDWEAFIEKLKRSKQDYDKLFYKYLKNDLLPVLREHEEKRVRDAWARERARVKSRLVVNRKRSSRLEEKSLRMEQRAEEERRNAEEQRHRIEQRRLEREERERLAAREKRLQERDARIEREQQELKPINQHLAAVQQEVEEENGGRRSRRSSRSSSPAAGSGRSTRSSSRVTKNNAFEAVSGVRRLGTATDRWEFDCYCGVYGDNYDDGTLIVGCSSCGLWMHVKCLGEDREELELVAEQANPEQGSERMATLYHEHKYVCERCRRKQRDEEERLEYARQVAAHKLRVKEQQQARKAAALAMVSVPNEAPLEIIDVSSDEKPTLVVPSSPSSLPSSSSEVLNGHNSVIQVDSPIEHHQTELVGDELVKTKEPLVVLKDEGKPEVGQGPRFDQVRPEQENGSGVVTDTTQSIAEEEKDVLVN